VVIQFVHQGTLLKNVKRIARIQPQRQEKDLNYINSQCITENLTHVTSHEGYDGIMNNGIKIRDMGKDALLYKPPGFWISINGDWEEWCTGNDFRDVKNATICNVYLKPNLLFIRISAVSDADELFLFLIPELKHHNLFPHFSSSFSSLSDLMNISQYQIKQLQKGNIVTARSVWGKALNVCDGIYYEDSSDLHFHTIFNTWDASSIVLFDPTNAIISKKEKLY